MSPYANDSLYSELLPEKRRWVVTGAAGFIGSHLCECLLSYGQAVVGIDNLATGFQKNLQPFVDEKSFDFTFVEGDVAAPSLLAEILGENDIVLHQAALGSVPRSFKEPVESFRANVLGFVNVLEASRLASCAAVVFASSSSVYGDAEKLPKREGDEGNILSPYALTKLVDEQIADLYSRHYEFPVLGLRYFNVFGPRQNPNGAYAAVIPRWIEKLRSGESCELFGDGTTSRDFTFVTNVVDANLLAALRATEDSYGKCFNVASGGRVTLRELYQMLEDGFVAQGGRPEPLIEGEFREGDIKHSFADVGGAKGAFSYESRVSFEDGIRRTLEAYLST